MRFSITAKLFVAILATSLLVALAMGVAARVAFTRGFVGYLNEQGVQRIEAAIPTLIDAYQEHGSWDFLKRNPRGWFRMLRPAGPEPGRGEGQRPPTPPSESDLTGVSLRVALLDSQRQLVVGYPQIGAGAVMRPIVLPGETAPVGWIALAPFESASAEADVRFQSQQLRANLVIGGLSVLLAALVAFGLARVLLAPVKRVAGATRQLASGDYGTRVKVSSRDEVGRLAEDFNRLALALENNQRMRRAFMADVSHELRTPLAVLKGELEALEDGVRPLTADSIRSLQAETTQLSKLVSDLYDLSLSDVGALAYRRVDTDVADALRISIDSVRERLRQRGLQLSEAIAPEPLIVSGDESRLRQLFGNLLENSLRYTDAGGELRVSCRAEGDRVSIVFEDSAPGVPADLLPRLFDRFYRVESSRSRAGGGAGLGLAISRSIVEAHEGEIGASASALGGLRLTIRLPRVPVA